MANGLTAKEEKRLKEINDRLTKLGQPVSAPTPTPAAITPPEIAAPAITEPTPFTPPTLESPAPPPLDTGAGVTPPGLLEALGGAPAGGPGEVPTLPFVPSIPPDIDKERILTERTEPTPLSLEEIKRAESTVGKDIGEAVSNIPASAGRLILDVLKFIVNPKEAAGFLAGLTVESAFEILGKPIPGEKKDRKEGERFRGKGGVLLKREQLASFFKDRYGGLANVKKTIINDPVGFAADVSVIASLGGTALQSSKLSKIGAKIEPTGLITKAGIGVPAKVGERLLREITGITTSQGIRALDIAKLGSPKFIEALRGRTTRADIATLARDAFTALKNERGVEYRKRLSKLKSAEQSLDVTSIKTTMESILADHGIKRGKKITGKLDFRDSTMAGNIAEQRRVQSIVKLIDTLGTRKGSRTGLGLDTLKRNLDDFYSPSSNARSIVTGIRNEVKNTIIKDIPEYRAMVEEYAARTADLREIEGTFSLGTKARVDTTINKLTASLKTNPEFRAGLLKELERVGGKGIEDVIAGTALRGLAPSGFSGRVFTGIQVLGGATIDPKLFALVLLASPRIMGEFFLALGQGTRLGQKIAKSTGILSPLARGAAFQTGRQLRVGEEQAREAATTEPPANNLLNALSTPRRVVP